MIQIEIKTFQDYIEKTERRKDKITLFRGQPEDHPLLPSIARNIPREKQQEIEIKLIEEFKRRSPMFLKQEYKNDWDWLVHAQHFNLKTRLLDWTSNSLTALWFACSEENKSENDSFVYVLRADKSLYVDLNEKESPFEISTTKILRPYLNNERILAQAGLFTAHHYSVEKGFSRLGTDPDNNIQIEKLSLAKELKPCILKKLSDFGISSRTLLPDISGLCRHLNWKYWSNEVCREDYLQKFGKQNTLVPQTS